MKLSTTVHQIKKSSSAVEINYFLWQLLWYKNQNLSSYWPNFSGLFYWCIFRQTSSMQFSICLWTKSYYINNTSNKNNLLLLLSYNYSLLDAFYFVCIFCSLNSLMTLDQLFQSDCFLIWSDMQHLAIESHELHCQSLLHSWDCRGTSHKQIANSKRKCLHSWNLYIRSEVPSLWIYSVLPAVQELQVYVVLWPFPFHLLQCLQNTRDREGKLNKKYRK